jgi:hypothetical protein
MNLEAIENRCLTYLRQSKQPLVPLTALVEHCTRAPGMEEVTPGFLRSFLNNHVDVLVFEGPGNEEGVDTGLLAAAGIDLGTRVILKERMPSVDELSSILAEQVTVMVEQLERALAEATDRADSDRVQQISAALARAQALRARMRSIGASTRENCGREN